MLRSAHLVTMLILQAYSLQGLNENQRRYLRKCPHQNITLPCLPDIDSFITSKLNQDWDIQKLFSKAYIPGVCYNRWAKFCPTKLLTCQHKDNLGYNHSLSGLCIQKSHKCPGFSSAQVCSDLRCPTHQYLCHPMGCINLNEPCNGLCPPVNVPTTIAPSTTTSTTTTSTTTTTITRSDSMSSLAVSASTSTTEASTTIRFNSSRSLQRLFQNTYSTSRDRYLCGNFCISREESGKFYDCDGTCQPKTLPCESDSEDGKILCPQHYTLCGTNTCLDSFEMSLVEAETGYPSHYSCQGNCTESTEPCLNNGTMQCQPGYWLCENQKQCILHFIGREVLLSQICDGYAECEDSSDEFIVQCAKVYAVEIAIFLVIITSSVPVTIILILMYRQRLCTIRVECIKFGGLTSKQRSLSTEKGYEGNEDEMHLRALAPEDVD